MTHRTLWFRILILTVVRGLACLVKMVPEARRAREGPVRTGLLRLKAREGFLRDRFWMIFRSQKGTGKQDWTLPRMTSTESWRAKSRNYWHGVTLKTKSIAITSKGRHLLRSTSATSKSTTATRVITCLTLTTIRWSKKSIISSMKTMTSLKRNSQFPRFRGDKEGQVWSHTTRWAHQLGRGQEASTLKEWATNQRTGCRTRRGWASIKCVVSLRRKMISSWRGCSSKRFWSRTWAILRMRLWRRFLRMKRATRRAFRKSRCNQTLTTQCWWGRSNSCSSLKRKQSNWDSNWLLSKGKWSSTILRARKTRWWLTKSATSISRDQPFKSWRRKTSDWRQPTSRWKERFSHRTSRLTRLFETSTEPSPIWTLRSSLSTRSTTFKSGKAPKRPTHWRSTSTSWWTKTTASPWNSKSKRKTINSPWCPSLTNWKKKRPK